MNNNNINKYNNVENNYKEKYDIYYNFLLLNNNIKYISLFKNEIEVKYDVYKIDNIFNYEINNIINDVINDIKNNEEGRELYNLCELDSIYLALYFISKNNNTNTEEIINDNIKKMFYELIDLKSHFDKSLEIILQCRYINLINEKLNNFKKLNYNYKKIINSINKFTNYNLLIDKITNYIINNNIKFIVNSIRINDNQLVIKNKGIVDNIITNLKEKNENYQIYNFVDINIKYINSSLNIIKSHHHLKDSSSDFKNKATESIKKYLTNNINLKDEEIDELYVDFLIDDYIKYSKYKK